eukprot:3701707-Pyramimonas_sp.AAC.1
MHHSKGRQHSNQATAPPPSPPFWRQAASKQAAGQTLVPESLEGLPDGREGKKERERERER